MAENINYNKDLCNEKHKTLDTKIDDHEKRINNHSVRIDKLEQDSAEYKTEIRNLCLKVEDLISTIKWGLGIFITVSIFVIGILLKR